MVSARVSGKNKKFYTYEFPKASNSTDMIVEKDGKILLVQRKNDPFKGYWALPGGFLEAGEETLEQTAARELKEETNLVAKELELLGVYSDPHRDPRGHTIDAAFVITKFSGKIKAKDDAKKVKFIPINTIISKLDLAFDHKQIIEDYLKWKDIHKK